MCNENLNCYNKVCGTKQTMVSLTTQIVGNDDVESNRGGSVVEVRVPATSSKTTSKTSKLC